MGFRVLVLVLVRVREILFKSFEYEYAYEYAYDKAEASCFMQQSRLTPGLGMELYRYAAGRLRSGPI